jgi:hypothetical protein
MHGRRPVSKQAQKVSPDGDFRSGNSNNPVIANSFTFSKADTSVDKITFLKTVQQELLDLYGKLFPSINSNSQQPIDLL